MWCLGRREIYPRERMEDFCYLTNPLKRRGGGGGLVPDLVEYVHFYQSISRGIFHFENVEDCSAITNEQAVFIFPDTRTQT